MYFEPSDSIRRDLLAQARRRLLAADSQAAVFAAVRETARQACGSDGITIVLREDGLCHYVEEDAIAPLWKGKRFPMSACISGWAMTHARTVVIEDVFADPRIPYDAYLPTFVKSMIMTPVSEEAPVAAIGAYWREVRSFSDAEILTVKTLSLAVGTALAGLL